MECFIAESTEDVREHDTEFQPSVDTRQRLSITAESVTSSDKTISPTRYQGSHAIRNNWERPTGPAFGLYIKHPASEPHTLTQFTRFALDVYQLQSHSSSWGKGH